MVLKTGLVHELVHDQPIRVEQEVPLAAFDLFAPVVAAPPPFWLVLTDWLSMMAALADRPRPPLPLPAPRPGGSERFPGAPLPPVPVSGPTAGPAGKGCRTSRPCQ